MSTTEQLQVIKRNPFTFQKVDGSIDLGKLREYNRRRTMAENRLREHVLETQGLIQADDENAKKWLDIVLGKEKTEAELEDMKKRGIVPQRSLLPYLEGLKSVREIKKTVESIPALIQNMKETGIALSDLKDRESALKLVKNQFETMSASIKAKIDSSFTPTISDRTGRLDMDQRTRQILLEHGITNTSTLSKKGLSEVLDRMQIQYDKKTPMKDMLDLIRVHDIPERLSATQATPASPQAYQTPATQATPASSQAYQTPASGFKTTELDRYKSDLEVIDQKIRDDYKKKIVDSKREELDTERNVVIGKLKMLGVVDGDIPDPPRVNEEEVPVVKKDVEEHHGLFYDLSTIEANLLNNKKNTIALLKHALNKIGVGYKDIKNSKIKKPFVDRYVNAIKELESKKTPTSTVSGMMQTGHGITPAQRDKLAQIREIVDKLATPGLSEDERSVLFLHAQKLRKGLRGPALQEGKGILDTLKGPGTVLEKVGEVAKEIFRRIKNFFLGINEMSSDIKTLLETETSPIQGITLKRAPIQEGIKKVLNFLSDAQIEANKKKLGYDEIYHLAMIVTLRNGKQFLVEKRPRVVITKIGTFEPNATFKNVNVSYTLTLGELIMKGVEKVGKQKFFSYTASKENCQKFLVDILQANGLLTPEIRAWVQQDVEALFKDSKDVAQLSDSITGIKHRLDGLFGYGLKDKIKHPKGHDNLATLINRKKSDFMVMDDNGSLGKIVIEKKKLANKRLVAYSSKGEKLIDEPCDPTLIYILTKRWSAKQPITDLASDQITRLFNYSKVAPAPTNGKWKQIIGPRVEATKVVYVDNDDGLVSEFERLVGAISAGNTSDDIKRQLSAIIDKMLMKGLLSKGNHRDIFNKFVK